MTDEELVKRLRAYPNSARLPDNISPFIVLTTGLANEAADRIEPLQAELAAERENAAQWKELHRRGNDVNVELSGKLDAALAVLKVAREALEFYADPSDRDRRVPDFYDELCFCDVAEEALAQIDAVLGGGDE